MKKKIIALGVAAALSAALLVGCGSTEEAAIMPQIKEGDQLSRIQDKGEIVIAMEGTWTPWNYHDERGNLVGFDTEVGRRIANKLGVNVVFVEGEWDTLFAGLDSEQYDIILNGVGVTDERTQQYDFSEPYGYIHTALIVRNDNTEITCFDDLAGKTTANSMTSTYRMMAEDYGATIQRVESLDDCLQMVLTGGVDATLNADVTFFYYRYMHPDTELQVVDYAEDTSLVAIPMRKGEDSASLRAAINQALQELRDSGELSTISIKYFGSDITQN